jgi:hypothetical protein
MADYYSVLSSAVAKLETNVESARRGLYDRARKAVMARMHAITRLSPMTTSTPN